MIGPTDDDITVLVEDDERGPTVRLPAGLFRPGDRVRVRREEQPAGPAPAATPDAVIAEVTPEAAGGWVPKNVHPDWPPGFWEKFAQLPPVSDEFVRGVYEARREWNAWPVRPDLDDDSRAE